MLEKVRGRKCSVCEQPGHYAATCPDRKKYTANNFSDGKVNKAMVERSKKQATGATPMKNNKGSLNMAQVDKKVMKSDFEKALAADAEVDKLELKKKELILKRSQLVQHIAENYGKGPFNVQGKLLEIRSRKGMNTVIDKEGNEVKEPDGTENFFFVQRGEQGVTNVD